VAGKREPANLATTLANMARHLLAQRSVEETLNWILVHAVDLVDGCEAVGIAVIRDHNSVHTLAATDEMVRASDGVQNDVGEGPCFDAIRSRDVRFRVDDSVSMAERWPRYAPHAEHLGISSVLGFKLFTEDEDLGALLLYSSRHGAFSTQSEHVGQLLACHAAVAFSGARAAANFKAALSSHQQIGQAVGILMERHSLSNDDAFAVLVRTSKEKNTKLREVARHITEGGHVLSVGRNSLG
jgi:transcriptional regulator with GAF, ATPase, and Fis domain